MAFDTPASASIAVQLGAGGGRGILKTDQNNNVQAYPTQLSVQYKPGFGLDLPFSVSAVIEHQTVSCQIKDANYEGSNLLFGGGLGVVFFKFRLFTLRSEAVFYPQSQLSLQNETDAMVNGANYKHATLSKYLGSTAQSLEISLLTDINVGKSRKNQRGRWGVAGNYLKQNFKKLETYVATSNRVLAPNSYTVVPSEASYQLLSIRLLLAFVF